jgi:hypothetical protein
MPKFVASLSKRQSQRYVRRAPCAPHRDVTKDQVLERDGKVPLIKCNVVWVGEQPGRRESNPIIRSPACLDCLLASTLHTRLATLLSNGRKARKASFLLAINRESNGSVGDRTRSARARVLLPFPPWLARRPCMHASLMRAGPCRCRERTPHGTRHRERARGHQPPRPPGLVAASNSRAGRRRHRAIMTRRDASACTYRYSAPSALAFSRSLTQKYSQVAGKL